MKDLTAVKQFYDSLALSSVFDYKAVTSRFLDVFGEPSFIKADLPWLGNIEISLTAISRPLYTPLVAVDDGVYNYKSEVVFLVKPTSSMPADLLRWKVVEHGPFKGLVLLDTFNRSLVGHPMRQGKPVDVKHPKGYTTHGFEWYIREPSDFDSDLKSAIEKEVRPRLFPKELHQYPFDKSDHVYILVKDVNMMGGRRMKASGDRAVDIAYQAASRLIEEKRGNVNVFIAIWNEKAAWNIPPFGKNHVSLID